MANVGFGENSVCAAGRVPGRNIGWVELVSKSMAIFPYFPSLLKQNILIIIKQINI